MNRETEKAKTLLESGEPTLVLCSKTKTITSAERGVKTLLAFVKEKKNLKGFSAADKVVGKGAAALFCLLGIKELYTPLISEGARGLLEENGIEVFFDEEVKNIINRKGDGICPVESALGEERELSKCLEIIEATVLRLSGTA